MAKKNKNKDVESNFLLNWGKKKFNPITKTKQKNQFIKDHGM